MGFICLSVLGGAMRDLPRIDPLKNPKRQTFCDVSGLALIVFIVIAGAWVSHDSIIEGMTPLYDRPGHGLEYVSPSLSVGPTATGARGVSSAPVAFSLGGE